MLYFLLMSSPSVVASWCLLPSCVRPAWLLRDPSLSLSHYISTLVNTSPQPLFKLLDQPRASTQGVKMDWRVHQKQFVFGKLGSPCNIRIALYIYMRYSVNNHCIDNNLAKLNRSVFIYRKSPIILLMTKDILWSYNANMATFYHLETACPHFSKQSLTIWQNWLITFLSLLSKYIMLAELNISGKSLLKQQCLEALKLYCNLDYGLVKMHRRFSIHSRVGLGLGSQMSRLKTIDKRWGLFIASKTYSVL